jgi:hypothetical protein
MKAVRRVVAGAAVAALAGCGGHDPARSARAARPVVSVGHPTPPRHAEIQQGGTLELAAPGMRLAVLHAPGADPRDVCVGVLPAGALYLEADVACDVRVPGSPTLFVMRPGEGAPAVVAGVAPPGVARVRVSGPGGPRRLPLSRHRAFMAVYAVGTRGRVRVSAGGRTAATFRLGHTIRLPRHRRRGAVFGDEVGERILRSSYTDILRRFGAPAARGRHRGRRCLNYAVVGEGPGGWWFCFAPGGRMVSADHSS